MREFTMLLVVNGDGWVVINFIQCRIHFDYAFSYKIVYRAFDSCHTIKAYA